MSQRQELKLRAERTSQGHIHAAGKQSQESNAVGISAESSHQATGSQMGDGEGGDGHMQDGRGPRLPCVCVYVCQPPDLQGKAILVSEVMSCLPSGAKMCFTEQGYLMVRCFPFKCVDFLV